MGSCLRAPLALSCFHHRIPLYIRYLGNRSGSAKTSQTGFANAGRESGAPLTAGRESPILVLREDALLESRSLPKTRRGSISVCCGR